MSELTAEDWFRIDSLLGESRIFAAVMLYREIAGCGLADAKSAIGHRFQTGYPDLWREYRDVGEED